MPPLVAGEAAERSRTAATAIRIADPVHAREAERAVERSRGEIVRLTDEAILRAWRELAHEEGLFCEPSSAAGLAAVGELRRGSGMRIVCVVTGHGLKDPETVSRTAPEPIAVDPDPDAIASAAA
jgi:threonine synthase